MNLLRSGCAVLILSSSLLAATQLTLDDALSQAERNHPRLREAGAQLDFAAAGIETARAYPNPTLDFTGARQNARVSGALPGFYQYYIFSQPIDLPSVREPRMEAARLGRDSELYTVSESRLAVRTAVRQAFFEVLRWEGAHELALESLRLIQDLRRRIQVQVDVGEAGRLELVRAQAEEATAQSVANRARLEMLSALSGLRAAIGAPAGSDIDPDGSLEQAPVLPELDRLRAEVSERYPALARARIEMQRYEAVVRTEVALRKPQPTARFEWERLPDTTLYRFGVAFPLPLWNRREGPIAEAEAQLRRSRASAERTRIEITAALESAYGRYQIAGQQVEAFEGGVLRGADEAVRAAEAAYRLGERGILEVLDAQRVLRSVRLELLNARFDRQAAWNDLRHLRALDLNTP